MEYLPNLISILGIFVLMGIAFVFSKNRSKIRLKLVIWGILLQIIFAILILKTPWGFWIFDQAKGAVNKILQFTDEGASFVLGPLAIKAGKPGSLGFIFTFQVLTTIIFFAALMAVLYHLGIVQVVVAGMAKVMTRFMGVSGAESLSVAANVFVGQTEAPLVIKPYIAKMTESELMALMTGGFATIAGGVLVAYVSLGISAGHLLAASIMSAPAAFVMAKIMIPETEQSQTAGDVTFKLEKVSANVIDAAAAGAGDGVRLAINVAAMLLAFLALIAMLDSLLGAFGDLLNYILGWFGLHIGRLSLRAILGFIFWPIAWVMGVPADNCSTFGGIIGTKITLNEFVAYTDILKNMPLSIMNAEFSTRAVTLATYACCGFANFGSIAIQLGGIGGIAPEKRPQLARLGLRALMAGALASFMTASIAGILISNEESDFRYVNDIAARWNSQKKFGKALFILDEFVEKYSAQSSGSANLTKIKALQAQWTAQYRQVIAQRMHLATTLAKDGDIQAAIKCYNNVLHEYGIEEHLGLLKEALNKPHRSLRRQLFAQLVAQDKQLMARMQEVGKNPQDYGSLLDLTNDLAATKEGRDRTIALLKQVDGDPRLQALDKKRQALFVKYDKIAARYPLNNDLAQVRQALQQLQAGKKIRESASLLISQREKEYFQTRIKADEHYQRQEYGEALLVYQMYLGKYEQDWTSVARKHQQDLVARLEQFCRTQLAAAQKARQAGELAKARQLYQAVIQRCGIEKPIAMTAASARARLEKLRLAKLLDLLASKGISLLRKSDQYLKLDQLVDELRSRGIALKPLLEEVEQEPAIVAEKSFYDTFEEFSRKLRQNYPLQPLVAQARKGIKELQAADKQK